MNPQTQTAIVAAITAGAVTAIGWYITYLLSKKKEYEARRQEAALRHLQRQIEDLYGPLLGLIQYNRFISEVAAERLPARDEDGRRKVSRSKFTPTDVLIYKYLIETYFLPINAQIATLLRTKLYPLESATIPDSFRDFLRHDAYFQSLHRMYVEKKIESTFIKGPGWPPQFER